MEQLFKKVNFTQKERVDILKQRGWIEYPVTQIRNNIRKGKIECTEIYWVKPNWTEEQKNLFKLNSWYAFDLEEPLLEYEFNARVEMSEMKAEKEAIKKLMELFNNSSNHFINALAYKLGNIIQDKLENHKEEYDYKKHKLCQNIATQFITDFIEGKIIPIDESFL